jgi:thioesterase DpgC
MQRSKEGWEVALGIFFQAVLSATTAGNHLLRSMLRPTERARAVLLDYQRTGRADLGVATVTRQDGIAHLELCNDEFLNAEDDIVVEALETGTDLVLLDPASHVGVLRGAPQTHPAYAGRRVFSAGINLTNLYHGDISLLGFMLRREAGYIAKFVRGLCLDDTAGDGWWPDADKPWIAAVDTFAIGGGMQILPTMDRVVAADDSWFSLPAMEEGLVPGLANMRLLHPTGSRLSRRLIFWGRKLRATDPEASLFVDETVPADAMDGAVRAAAEHLDHPAVGANRRMLNLVEEPVDLFRRYLAQYAYEQACQLHSPALISTLERTWVNRNRGTGGGDQR